MTVPAVRPARGRRLPSWPQWSGTLVAVAASLAALSLPGAARAATNPGYDQMSGVGPTASAVTVPWTQGILDNTNALITSANADRTSATPTSPDAFMYNDFKNLVVKVSQTQDLGHQGITVSWTGGQPTASTGSVIQANFLQIMECWGDASSGPTPEQCEYGSAGLLPGYLNAKIGTRQGDTCVAGAVPSTTNPPAAANGSSAVDGCDPLEPGSDHTHVAPCPGTYCAADSFNIPFSPVTAPTTLDYAGATDTTYYSEFNTDEVQLSITKADGTGQQQFVTLADTQAPGLGCGAAETGNTPRGCWLVIVPRGIYEPNGYKINVNNGNSFINSSPLSASNWAQRIQIHLAFAPQGSFCLPGTLERQTFGTQLVARAMQSWQLALNQSANCTKIYAYSAVPEATSTHNLQAGGDSGLAFTNIPIGSEATRSGGSPPTNLPTILYAPVAIAALDFGFNINEGTGYVTTPVKLTPSLVAKALTQSYLQDLPDYYPNGGLSGPTWSKGNPLNISEDPTFQKLNTNNGVAVVPADPQGPIAPLLTEDHSAPNQQVWQWIQASPAATTWLGGTPDASDGNMTIDADYHTQTLNLGQAPAIDSFPRAYSGVLSLCEPANTPAPCATGQTTVMKHTLDLLPYTDNYDSASAAVLSATNSDASGWDANATAPNGTPGWWDKVGVEPLGSIFMWAAAATPDLAAYGLVPAQLCDDSGANCVGPTTASVTVAVGGATADSTGLLHVNPANPGTGGYPLTDVIYAAVATNQSAAALTDYANLISYAVGTGQTAGAAAGDLPPGYLPLPSNLVTKAQAVVTQLQALASPSPSPSPSTNSSSGTTSSPQSTATTATTSGTTPAATAATTAATTAAAGATRAATPTPTPATTPAHPLVTTPVSGLAYVPVTSSTHPGGVIPTLPTAPGYVTSLPPATAAAAPTPSQPVGAIRWALIAIAGVGGAFAGGGTLLRSGGIPLLRRRWLP